ncbi:MAG: hypothetical protein IKQ35_05145 [Bacilli bacterium]|nr:hypothetical protein [Bacilli bacterium]
MNNEITEEKVMETVEKANQILDKVKIIINRIVIGIIIIVLLVLIGIDSMIIKQTIKAKDYIDTTATYVDKKEEQESEDFIDYIYTFEDKKGEKQDITITIVKDEVPESEIKIKYDENNPQEFFEEGSTMGKNGFIWFFVKIGVVILLVILFFNKKLLSKMSFSVNRTK